MRDLSAVYDGQRLQTYSRLFAFAYMAAFAGLWAMSSGLVDPMGKPLGADFITFWSAGRLSLEGNPAAAFDRAAILAMQRQAVPGSEAMFLWHYPPTFQLVAAALATMPYVISYFVFVSAGLAAFFFALRPLVPWREAGVVLLALPGTFVCLLHGQNSFFTAALLTGAIVLIDRRPLWAGVCIGMLAYKPQFGVLFPLVLAITGRWRVMSAAAGTVVVFAGLATATFGFELWAEFLSNAALVRDVVETGQLPWGKMPSAYVFLRMLGAGQTAGYAGQALVAGTVVAVTSYVWWRLSRLSLEGQRMFCLDSCFSRVSSQNRVGHFCELCLGPTLPAGAVLISGTLLIAPYTFDYEMAILAAPLAIIARQLVEQGASMREKAGLLVLAAAPLAMGNHLEKFGLQVGFLALAAAFVWSARLALASARVRSIDCDHTGGEPVARVSTP